MAASSPSQTIFSINYDFHLGNGNNGNVWGIVNNRDSSRSQSFIYDALNRLLSAQNAGTDCTKTLPDGHTEYWGNSYVYDPWGNLSQKQVTKCSAENLSLSIAANNRAQGGSYLYDAAGNMLRDNNNLNYVYDVENRISSTAGFTYVYDGDGNRVKKSNGATGTLYWYASPGIIAESDLSGNIQHEYVFFGGERIARKDAGNQIFYYFSDHLKTASVVTDATGNVKNESDYYPWGGELQYANNDPANHYKFTGKERDQESGLDYFGARYYSSSLGRWISADWSSTPVPVPYADLHDPQTLNLYEYVGGNPASKADPDGHEDLKPTDWNKELPSSNWSLPHVDPVKIILDTLVAVQDIRGFFDKAIPFPCICPSAQPQNDNNNNNNNSNRQSSTQNQSGQGKQSGGQTGNSGMKPGSAGGPGTGKKTTPKQREQTLKQNGGKCIVPGCDQPAEHTDHAIPRSRNGDTTDANLQGMCAHHNCQKGAMNSAEYERWLKDHPDKK
jgi:RHS repeat-associated protein